MLNFYYKNNLKSGDLLQILFCKPKFVLRKKKSIIAKFQFPWHGKSKVKVLKNIPKCFNKFRQSLLFRSQTWVKVFTLLSGLPQIKKYWRMVFFFGRLVFKTSSLNKVNLSLVRRVNKVLVFLFIQIQAPNVLGLSKLKCYGIDYKRNSLSFIKNFFFEKYRRLQPLRRMHRKKRKNK